MIVDIELERVHPNPKQPRKHFEGIEELAQPLKDRGQLVPILVRPVEDAFELVHGERRWRAAMLAGLIRLRAEVKEMNDTEAFSLSLIENLQRANLTPIEEAEAFKVLIDGGMTQTEVGKLIGKSQSYVAHKLRMLSSPGPLYELVAMNALTEGHARQLLRFEGLYPQSAVVDRWRVEGVDISGAEFYEVMPLAEAYNELRPEDNPQAPLWRYPLKRIEGSKHLEALRKSLHALLEYVTNHNASVPQWVLATWWWGAATVIYDIPVADLKKLIDLTIGLTILGT